MSTMRANAFLDNSGGNTATINGIIPVAAGISKVTMLTSGTAATFTTDTKTKLMRVRMVGGGGGGGGTSAAANVVAGGGTGAMYVEALITAPAASYTYTIGAAGAGAAALSTAGGSGGNTLFGSYTALGGTGGAAGSTTTSKVVAPNYTASGDISFPGGMGHGGAVPASVGGDTPFGRGHTLTATNVNGSSGSGYGAGGSGGYNSATATTHAGGAGAPGLIIVEEFF